MIRLGDRVRDKISGMTGIATFRTEYLNGCIQYGVMPKFKKGSTELPTWSIDVEQLESLEKLVVIKKKTKRPPGGPTRRIY